MKSVLISIQPKWCELIANGKKTVEVRKTRPKLETPFKVYIYCTKGEALALPCLNNPHYTIHRMNNGTPNGRKMTAEERERSDHQFANGKVIGEFVCDRIDRIAKRGIHSNFDYCYCSLNVFGNDNIAIEITDIENSCIPQEELNSYGFYSHCLYAWHISHLVIYDKPKELSHFLQYCEYDYDIDKCIGCKKTSYNDLGQECCDRRITRPPQSWCYVEGGGSDA